MKLWKFIGTNPWITFYLILVFSLFFNIQARPFYRKKSLNTENFLYFTGCKLYRNLFFCNYNKNFCKIIFWGKYKKLCKSFIGRDCYKIVILQRFFCKFTEKKFYRINSRKTSLQKSRNRISFSISKSQFNQVL